MKKLRAEVYNDLLSDALEFINDAVNSMVEDPVMEASYRTAYAERGREMIDRIEAAIGDLPRDVEANTKVSKVQKQTLIELRLEEKLKPEYLISIANLAAVSGALSSFLPKRLHEQAIRNALRALRRKGLAEIRAAFDDAGYIRGSGYTLTAAGTKLADALHAELVGAA